MRPLYCARQHEAVTRLGAIARVTADPHEAPVNDTGSLEPT